MDTPTPTLSATMEATPSIYQVHVTVPDAPLVNAAVVLFVVVGAITFWKWLKRIVV